MKTTITKKLFLLLISGMFSFTLAEAQCTCTNNQPGWCSMAPNGHMRCYKRLSGFFRIDQNTSGSSLEVYFNPASYATSILFTLEQSQKVTLRIFDLSGRLVSIPADRVFDGGDNELEWYADNITSGIYILQFQSGENSESIKIAITK